MAAKNWEIDDRYPAIKASFELIKDEYLDDPFRCPQSFCIPVSQRPAVGWTVGRVTLIIAIVAFTLVGAGFCVGAFAEKQEPKNLVLITVAGLTVISGFAALFIPATCDGRILSWLLGERGRRLYDLSGSSDHVAAQIATRAAHDDKSPFKIAIDSDDYVMIAFDERNRRVLMEGTAARYQIRAEDVQSVMPFEWLNHIGVEILFQAAGNVELRLCIVRVSLLVELIRQAPILFFLKRFISNKIYVRFVETLCRPHDVG